MANNALSHVTISTEHLHRGGACSWCGRRNLLRHYAVYRRGKDLYTAELCDRCLEDCRREMEWTIREGKTECKS